jgi:hypothetical protein
MSPDISKRGNGTPRGRSSRVGDVQVVPPRRGGGPGGAVLAGHAAPEGGRRWIEGSGADHLVVRRRAI